MINPHRLAHGPLRLALAVALIASSLTPASVALAQSKPVEDCLIKTQQFDLSARDACDLALKSSDLSDEDRAQALVGRGIAATVAKDYQPAVNDFSEAIKLKADFATAYLMRGVAYRDLGQDDPAITDFGKSIELRPGLSAGYNDRAALLMKRQDWTGALADLNQLVTLVPKDPGVLFRRGYVQEKLRHADEASADYAAARALDPQIDDEMRMNGITPGN